jgi:uracil-DNA glycosylase family 4
MTCSRVDLECRRCRLSKGRTRVVPGAGSCSSPIVFIGEAPGREEDLRGEPFVGRAGRLLDAAFARSGVRRDQVFITNLVKCRPPGNRRPRKDEVDECFVHLESELEAVGPSVVCILGQTVARRLLGDDRSMAVMLRGEREMVIRGRRVRVYVAYHPAACLYQRKNMQAFGRVVGRSLVASGLARA